MRLLKTYRINIALCLTFAIFSACQEDLIIVDPPPPPVDLVEDCSHDYTVAVVDTNAFRPEAGITGQQSYYYEGYRIRDFSFSPNDPNQLVIAMQIHDLPNVAPELSSVLLKVDLCSGEESIIFESGPIIHHVDWGVNGRIVFGTMNYSPMSLATIEPDGSDLQISSYVGDVNLLAWLPNSASVLTRTLHSAVLQVDIDGTVISDNVNFPATPEDIDVMPDGRVAYNDGATIGIYDIENGINEIIDDQVLVDGYLDVAYSSLNNSLLWTTDTMLYISDIATGQRTALAYGFSQNRFYGRTQATKNGYMAYMAHICATTISNSSTLYYRTEIRFINPDGTDERRLVLDFE